MTFAILYAFEYKEMPEVACYESLEVHYPNIVASVFTKHFFHLGLNIIQF